MFTIYLHKKYQLFTKTQPLIAIKLKCKHTSSSYYKEKSHILYRSTVYCHSVFQGPMLYGTNAGITNAIMCNFISTLESAAYGNSKLTLCYSQYHLAARPVPTEVLENGCLISGGDPGATVTGELAPGVGVLASLPEDTPSVSI